ncbi:type II secretion system protein [Candidatus Saccharibacteria bacterium]|nr:type II secretion system protein [Candidatus Saccharibacteria bacterium]
MAKNKLNTKEGFTIIEVVLVLAVGGLIMMMVFLALPALQRSQRDTQRRDQLAGLVTQITQYQANNRNKLPAMTAEKVETFNDDGKAMNGATVATKDWAGFYNNYLLAGNDIFEDPNGDQYKLNVVKCIGTGSVSQNGIACDTQRSTADFVGQDYTILITYNSTCDGENIISDTGDRRVTVAYKLEGGGTFCQGN